MNDAVANLIFNRQTGTRLGILLSLLIGQAAGFGGSFTLQGQSKGSTNWITSNLQNWQELDYIPCRIYITGGPLINQTLTVDFPHLSGTTPGFQDLTSFVPSSNAILTSAPNLTMAASGRWTYTFKVNVTDGNPAYIQFLARLAAGSHLNTGSSLMLDGTPQSMGQLQLHKPAPGIGAPDLAIIKSGPATAAPGQIIAYTLSYTNKADGTNIAHGVQVSDILPAGIMADTNALGGGRLTGNTIFWDLSNQAPAAHGQISFQARVDSVDTNGFVLSNFAQVLSAENDANYADNSSTATTKVVVVCSAPLITQDPLSQTNCPGDSVIFSVSASGTAPLNYQWRKNGSGISSANNSTFSLGPLSASDAGSYDVVVSNACGWAASTAATLTVKTNVTVVIPPLNVTNCPGDTAVFGVTATGTSLSYQWYFNHGVLDSQTNSTLVLTNLSSVNAGTYQIVVSGECGMPVTNSAILVLNSKVIITTPTVNQTTIVGSNAVFSVEAIGTGLSYQWYYNGTEILGETNSILSLSGVTTNSAGNYCVVVSGACGAPQTNCATLTVNAPVTVITPPTDQISCPGTIANFSETATGTALTYQWYFNGGILIGETNNFLTLSNVTSANAGTYCIVADGAAGGPLTNCATLTVNTNVTVVAPPLNATNCPGDTAVFGVTATGTSLSYQWYHGTNVLSGQTNSALTITNVTALHAGTYTVVVSGPCGLPVTNSATLTVNVDLGIVTPPGNQITVVHSNVVFSVGAIGTGLNYQWYHDDSAMFDETNSVLSLSGVTTNSAGTYCVVVSGSCGAPQTNCATLKVNVPVTVITPPINRTSCPGTTVVFSETATATALTYQWYFNGGILDGQTNSLLTLTNVSFDNAGTYCVVAGGAAGGPLTNCATLTVKTNVTVVIPPLNVTNCPGDTAVFGVTATGTSLSYQWYFNHGVLDSQTNSTLVLTNLSSVNAGTYQIVVSGECGMPVTNSAILVLNSKVIITTPTVNQTTIVGSNAVFSVEAIGTGLSYQWYYNGTEILGETNSILSLSGVTTNSAGNYCVVVSGACGAPQTNCATLTVNAPVTVITPPTDQISCPGTIANFSETATGTALTYQWYFNGGILIGETNNFLTLSNVTSANAGTYCIVADGAAGGPLTNCATLTVNTNVTVVAPPLNATNCPGDTAVFGVTATGTSLSYQWYHGTNVLSGQTNSALTITNVTALHAGTYTVVVSGPCGLPVTNSATLTVNVDLGIVTPPGNQITVVHSNVVFSVGAIGTGLNYQWYHDDSAMFDETNSVLSLSGVTTNSAGTYCVVVSGSCGAPQTNCATLKVNVPVTVITPPINRTSCPGTTVVFSETATATALTYQWYFNGGILDGQTNSLLTLTNVSFDNAGTYCVVAGGAAGGPLTNCATLTVKTNVTVVIPPLNVTNCPGDTAVFGVTATGTSLSYQWYFNHGVLDSQTNSTLVLTNLSSVNAGTYQIVVSGECGMPVTNSAILVLNSKVIITTPTVNQTTIVGSNAVFSVEAIGTGLSYQWYYNGTEILGETNSILSLSGVTTNSAGNYCVVVSGACGAPQTNCATLTVNAPVTVITPPTDQISCPGTIANFSETATGTALTYQWYFNGGILIGETNNFLTLSNVTSANAGTYCIVADGAAGGPLTNCATLTVNTNVTVVAPPLNATNCPGDTAVFGVTATGTSLSYQWYHGTNVLSGQTNSALTITNVTALHAGTYTVVVSGPCGLPVTNSATLTVNVPVSVALIGSVIRNIGSSNTFAAVVSGTGPFSFQWFKDGNPLTGRTNSTLTLTNLQLSDVGQYGLRVTGACGTVPVTFSTLILNLPPTVAITNPTNNSVFIAPATFSLLASASDPDGVVTNVEFFHSTNAVDFLKIGETNIAPHFLVLTNLMTNHYSFTARATDDQGATGTSTPVNVMVIERPPLTLLGGVTFNPQSGLFHLTNIVFNPTYSIFNAVRVYIFGLSNSIVVVNASGTTNGVPYVQSAGPILPSTGWTNTIKFFVPVGALTPNPKLVPELIMPAVTAATITNGTGQHVVRGVFLQDRNFMVEFVTTATQRYYIQFSSDLKNWTTVQPSIPGNGTTIQWIDAGPPETDTLPSISNKRFYKVISTP